MVRQECMATIGAVSNPDNSNQNLGKAGRKRHMGVRPTVRGVAMNPIDHPHGGGEGRTSGGRHPVTPWGKGTKGAPHPQEQVDGQVHRPLAARSQEGALIHGTFRLERPVRRLLPAEEGREEPRAGAATK